MTREEIIRMAQDAGALVYAVNAGHRSGPYKTGRFSGPFVEVIIDVLFTPETLEHFVALVAAAEREACAKVLDEMADEAEADMEPSALVTYYREKAAAIRARGTKKSAGD